MTRIIGDIHGKWQEYKQIATFDSNKESIQIGDFGIGFNGPFWHDRVNEFHSKENHRFIRGNHDFPEKCKTDMVGYIPDGFVENDVMYIGGAWSIDHIYRTPGISWWEDEECSVDEFNQIIDIYTTVKPKIMITHDGPLDITDRMFIQEGKAIGGKNAKSILTKTGQALQAMYEIYQPEFWVFGHWHHDLIHKAEKTTFICLGELTYIDLDFNTLEISKTNGEFDNV